MDVLTTARRGRLNPAALETVEIEIRPTRSALFSIMNHVFPVDTAVGYGLPSARHPRGWHALHGKRRPSRGWARRVRQTKAAARR